MKFMYMDESGKNIITQHRQKVFIFGGLVIDKSNIYPALADYKLIYQKARNDLKTVVKKNLKQEKISEYEISKRMMKMFDNFEFHAVKMINRKDIIRNGKLLEENPWKYMNEPQIFEIIHNLLTNMSNYIDTLYMFKIDKQPYIEYINNKNIKPNDLICHQDMIEFIIEEYEKILCAINTEGALIPDRLDANIRDAFVLSLYTKKSKNLWSEPITVESNSNAFTQLIDLMTYFYYKIYIDDNDMPNFRSINKLYSKYLKDKLIEKDFIKEKQKKD